MAASPAVRIALGSVYRPPAAPYPRLLVMRRWPRGVRKDAVDGWERELGPGDELLDAFRAGTIDWPAFARRYRVEMAGQEQLIERVAGMAAATGVTLLCGSHSDERCHRSLLAELTKRRLRER